jgi:hypothetical protein
LGAKLKKNSGSEDVFSINGKGQITLNYPRGFYGDDWANTYGIKIDGKTILSGHTLWDPTAIDASKSVVKNYVRIQEGAIAFYKTYHQSATATSPIYPSPIELMPRISASGISFPATTVGALNRSLQFLLYESVLYIGDCVKIEPDGIYRRTSSSNDWAKL